MRHKDFGDLGRLMDEIFTAAEDFSRSVREGVHFDSTEDVHWKWSEQKDYYPMYSYPPTNVYMTEDKSLIFEFALAGFDEDSLEIEFRGDHMYLSGSISEDLRDNENVKYFKRKLKFKDIDGQKYFVPSDKFAQANTEASYKSGVLVVTIPARDTVEPKDSIKVKVGSSKSGGSSKSSSKSSSSKSSSSTDSQAGGSAKESGSQSNQSKGDTE